MRRRIKGKSLGNQTGVGKVRVGEGAWESGRVGARLRQSTARRSTGKRKTVNTVRAVETVRAVKAEAQGIHQWTDGYSEAVVKRQQLQLQLLLQQL